MSFERDIMHAPKRKPKVHQDWVQPGRERRCYHCTMPVFQGVPCLCERAQEEARRVRREQ